MKRRINVKVQYIEDLLTASEWQDLKKLKSGERNPSDCLVLEIAFYKSVLKERNESLNECRVKLKKQERKIEKLSQMSFCFMSTL